MGMYDIVICKNSLNGVLDTNIEYQTKYFDCYLNTYVITEDGKLLCNDAPIDFHGKFDFYTYMRSTNTFVEYIAKFTDGQLVNIKRVDNG